MGDPSVKFGTCGQVLLKYRKHAGSKSRQKSEDEKVELINLKRDLLCQIVRQDDLKKEIMDNDEIVREFIKITQESLIERPELKNYSKLILIFDEISFFMAT